MIVGLGHWTGPIVNTPNVDQICRVHVMSTQLFGRGSVRMQMVHNFQNSDVEYVLFLLKRSGNIHPIQCFLIYQKLSVELDHYLNELSKHHLFQKKIIDALPLARPSVLLV